MCDHTYCYTPAVQRIAGAWSRRRAGRDPVRRLGPHQPRPRPARRRRVLGPRAARPVDPRLHPARRRAARSRWRRTAPTRSAPAVPASATSPSRWRTAASPTCHVNWLSPTKIRTMIIGGSQSHGRLGRPEPGAAPLGCTTRASTCRRTVDAGGPARHADLLPHRRHGRAGAARDRGARRRRSPSSSASIREGRPAATSGAPGCGSCRSSTPSATASTGVALVPLPALTELTVPQLSMETR